MGGTDYGRTDDDAQSPPFTAPPSTAPPLAGNVFVHLLEIRVVADEGAGWRATQEVQDSMALVCFPLEEGRLWEGE